jgi:hypothetical protein
MRYTHLATAMAAYFTIATAAPVERPDISEVLVPLEYKVYFNAGTPESVVHEIAQAGVLKGALITEYWGPHDDSMLSQSFTERPTYEQWTDANSI